MGIFFYVIEPTEKSSESDSADLSNSDYLGVQVCEELYMKNFKECQNIEWKEKLTRTYLKTVSAYANYGTGKIYFGINDKGERVGVDDTAENVLNLENQINDAINPRPEYQISIEDNQIIVLEVFKGEDVPYCYKGKAYRRNDTSTVEVTLREFRNLVLKGKNTTFTDIPCRKEDLTFTAFESAFQDRFGIIPQFPDTYITLELLSQEDGFTNAALLISEQNSFPGIDLIVYGTDSSEIQQRFTIENCSLFDQIQKIEDLFLQNYQFEKVTGMERVIQQRIPFEAFRELAVNAIVHREWQIDGKIKIEFSKDGILITSPGGLPDGIDEESYLSDHHISILRNKTLGLLFLKLGLIENLGSGLPMIQNLYRESIHKPQFWITKDSISGFLPVQSGLDTMSQEEKDIYQLVRQFQPVSSTVLQEKSGYGKSAVQRILNGLIKNRLVRKTGKARSTRYSLMN